MAGDPRQSRRHPPRRRARIAGGKGGTPPSPTTGPPTSRPGPLTKLPAQAPQRGASSRDSIAERPCLRDSIAPARPGPPTCHPPAMELPRHLRAEMEFRHDGKGAGGSGWAAPGLVRLAPGLRGGWRDGCALQHTMRGSVKPRAARGFRGWRAARPPRGRRLWRDPREQRRLCTTAVVC